jgi:hypothetical protein
MSAICRTDKIIGAALVALLLALLGLALAQRSGSAHPSAPATPRGATNLVSGAAPWSAPSTGRSSVAASTSSSATATSADATSTSGSSATSTTTSSATSTVPVAPTPGPVSAVGDSIMLDIQPYLAADLPGARIDGLVSRQFESGIAVVQADRAAGTLGNVLIVELGDNGPVTPSDFDAMMQAASGVKRVVFVNLNVPRSWEAPDNAVLAAGVDRYPGVAVLADWNAVSSGHPEWFTPDQVHLEPAGAQALANLVAGYA